jgi:hypothetical protein
MALGTSQQASFTHSLSDPSFTRNREIPLHRWVPWVAGFSAEFVQTCIEKYLRQSPSPVVMDPFAGVGTTLIEAYCNGCNVVGFEINPYAALATRVKVQATLTPTKRLQNTILAFERHMHRPNPKPRTPAPDGFRGRTQLFSPAVEQKVLWALEFIFAVKETPIRELFLLAFGAVMISFSNYSYEPSLTRRASVGKSDIEDADVAEVIFDKLSHMLNDCEEVQRLFHNSSARPTAQLFPESNLAATKRVKKSSIDLIVTSPPYLNNYHYPRNTRPQIAWLRLGKGSGYSAANEDESFGKFWQTARTQPKQSLSFDMPELTGVIEQIRGQNPDKGVYGGFGWANYAATYFNDTDKFCSVISNVLKPGSAAVVVLGNSIIQGINVRTDEWFGKVGERHGMALEDIHIVRTKRNGNSIIRSAVRTDAAPQKAMLYESAVVLRKI